MANRKSRSKRRGSGKAGSLRATFLWLLMTFLTVGGAVGFLCPDLPVLGPLVQSAQRVLGAVVDRLPKADSRQAIDADELSRINASVPASLASHPRPANKLLIASFNIQVFGKSKLAKPDVMSVIVHTIRQFDIVAIQEIRGKDDNILPDLVEMLNSDGSRYQFVIGPRLGRSVSTEQYAFVFDSNRVEHDPTSTGTIQDPRDLMHREPLVARFRSRTQVPDRAFSFWLVNVHTDPDDVPTEIAALADVFEVMQRARPYEDDVILLGDLNASERQMGRFARMPGLHWVVGGGVTTNTRQTKAYDNVLFYTPSTVEFTGRWGVFGLESVFRLTREQALRVSDHLPVWAEFDVWEGGAPRRAGADPGFRR
ncbi:MAG: endonuclease/exonuclease/phosphatase family protein [Mariniblastus sp.]|nr:endonuclease/exonuclease/phosphatase family protein [Mariniblastus sp.]